MVEFSPGLQLQTLFLLNASGRIVSTREPNPSRGPQFALIRGPQGCAWSVHASVPDELAVQLGDLASEEPPVGDLRADPVYAQRYVSLFGGRVDSGPVFTFPEAIPEWGGIVTIQDLAPLQRYFHGWTADEIPERSPILAVVEDGNALSVCFCARRSAVAAEAGVETAEAFRGRGLARLVTATWALAIRESGRLPLYSTSWSNAASLAVARQLGLEACGSDWSLYE